MLNGRLYRAAFLPFFFALAIAAFSLTGHPRSLTSTLAPDAFNGAHASAELTSLAAEFPNRRPGSRADASLEARVAHTLEALGGTAGGGFTVRTRRFAAQTIDGERTLTTVTAQRPGSTERSPIVILAHRDSAAHGRAAAELSGTAALLELARVFAARETKRTIVLVSTSGGTGGDAGATDFAAHAQAPLDAAIVLGDLAGAHARKPFVVPFSDGFGNAPLQLQSTIADAITQETGSASGAPSTLGQLAHLIFPFTVGEQGPLNRAGLPAVLVQVSGERGPSAGDAVSRERLEGFGRAVLSAVDALDVAPDITSTPQTGVLVQRKTFPAWALRLLLATLLLPPLIATADGLARVRRRGESVGRSLPWALACALPFFIAAMFARLLGSSGILGSSPASPVAPNALPFDWAAGRAVLAVVLVFVLAWLLWPMFLRRLRVRPLPDSDAAGIAMLIVLLAVCLAVWAADPFTALLLVPALHLWLLVVSPELRGRPPAALSLVALGLAPLALVVAFYAHQLGLDPGQVAWTAVLLLAGGYVGVPAAILWSLAFGCAAAAIMLALRAPAASVGPTIDDRPEITIRGPISYAGPGSLGGTRSALRR
jgi:Peptidase family M28